MNTGPRTTAHYVGQGAKARQGAAILALRAQRQQEANVAAEIALSLHSSPLWAPRTWSDALEYATALVNEHQGGERTRHDDYGQALVRRRASERGPDALARATRRLSDARSDCPAHGPRCPRGCEI